ncbi:MAG TPA: aldehyde ferredoxin oxidoreductase N-terminal domain-containing protein [Planctomycetota bacterium]|nr:aldehyde ferredoxin oxidoreductase N-terminal domain-containing protein [Planctomycetota bacterium]HRR80009.1 aldehyde ferredoxin oxidoreductase N-terminal domain-containing protein [Planctomycetota bacterium]HRT97139.1 aldehyde ferredoxin oxidoreductase N-terminal domain-containing protein [Planctomycetota bacterium]
MLPDDPLSRVLVVDLSRREARVEKRPELFERSLGGAGAAIGLLDEECPRGADPLGPHNPIVLAVGPLTGLFPLASKTVAMFKSPLTGNLGESHAGGRSAVALRLAGYGALVLRGASESPVYVAVHGDRVFFRDASSLWGVRSSATVARVIRQREPEAGFRSILRIGRAGEERLPYACVTTETYRHFGRMGLGAVFGAKRLKALVVSGRRSLPVADARAYRQTYREIHEAAVASPLMKKYHDVGTPENVVPLNLLKGLPTRNLQQACFEGAERISGEHLAEEFLGRRLACAHCPVGCIHLAALREPSAHEPYFYKTSMIGYDYEPIYALGSLLGGAEPAGLLRLMDAIEVVGLDAMSTGVALAWATEAMERGLVKPDDAGGLALRWGDYAAYAQAVQWLVEPPTDFFRALARGVEHASAVYGGADFALAFGGLEMPGYHTGPGAHLGFLTGARHSHLDSAGYSLDQKAVKAGDLPSPPQVAQSLLKEERWRQVLSSLVVCFFARNIYAAPVVAKALASAGIARGEGDLTRLGADVLRAKHAFKRREGFSWSGLRIPRRILDTPSPLGPLSPQFLEEALAAFAAAAEAPEA